MKFPEILKGGRRFLGHTRMKDKPNKVNMVKMFKNRNYFKLELKLIYESPPKTWYGKINSFDQLS